MDKKGPFGEYLEKSFIEWMRVSGEVKTQQDFADYLGIERSLLSHYMNGRRKPSPEAVDLMAKKLGQEIYAYIEYQNPNPVIRAINNILNILPEEDNLEILEQLRKRKSGDQRSKNEHTQENHSGA